MYDPYVSAAFIFGGLVLAGGGTFGIWPLAALGLLIQAAGLWRYFRLKRRAERL
jgi:hypothetical protein